MARKTKSDAQKAHEARNKAAKKNGAAARRAKKAAGKAALKANIGRKANTSCIPERSLCPNHRPRRRDAPWVIRSPDPASQDEAADDPFFFFFTLRKGRLFGFKC